MNSQNKIYHSILKKKKEGKKAFAILIDPDKIADRNLDDLIKKSQDAKVDYFFVGGSLVTSNNLTNCIQRLKNSCNIPVLLFPGHPSHISANADALLYLSLISGRNADLLIGQHVISAPVIMRSGLEIISTGYMVIDGGSPTSVSYMTNASPIPSNKNDIAYCTAVAGEMLGLKLIFMDAGSGAQNPVSEQMIAKVAAIISVPLLVGGGIGNAEKAYRNCTAGADIIVVGNAIETDRSLILQMADAIHNSVTTKC